ncbi:acyl-protein synthetase [Bradymonadaceae bacterium TMQ3]|nr:acyl-protein synthetase [Bradymonadaceae bacterium TMQ3]TXC68527.1 acyl-protein synthetase [Bradymonadales bacterium TMQ1]
MVPDAPAFTLSFVARITMLPSATRRIGRADLTSPYANSLPAMTSRDQLLKTLHDAIAAWNPTDDPLTWPEQRVLDLARPLFNYQYTHNLAYRTLCRNRGVGPSADLRLEQIPAVPTDAFKALNLFSGPESVRTFRTSGTTQGARGQHHFATLELYRAALHPTFVRFCNPEKSALRLIILAPSPADLPDSSLSFMLGELMERWGAPGSCFVVELRENAWHLDPTTLERALDEASTDTTPTMLLGTAFGFVELLDRTRACWTLPEGSRLMETGGFKGRSRTVDKADLYRLFEERLGIPASRCISEYSMTELSSQTYTDALASPEPTGRLFAPPWLNLSVVDPLTLQPLTEPGTTGLIRFIDLANLDSVMAIQTSDRGILHPDGSLELLGRAPDAELRGCSLTIEEIVEGVDPR